MIGRRASSSNVPFGGRRGAAGFRAAALLAADVVSLSCAWLIAVALAAWNGRSWWAQDWCPLFTTSGHIYTLMALVVVVGLAMSGQYARRAAFWEETRVAWRYALLAALTHFALNFFLQVTNARTLPVLAWMWALLLMPVARLLAREALIGLGCWSRMVLIVGTGDTAWEAAQAIRRERHLGLRVAGFTATGESAATPSSPHVPVAPHAMAIAAGPRAGDRPESRPETRPEWAHGLPVYALPPDGAHDATFGVEQLAHRLGCEAIVVALNGEVPPALAALVGRLHAQQFEIFAAQALQGLPVQGMRVQHFFSNDVLFLRLQHQLFSPLARTAKRGMDVVGSVLLLLIFSPLMAWAAWCIWRQDGAPVLYRQARIGHGEADFALIKFRTMVRDADAVLASWKTERPDLYACYETGNFKLAGDPRVLRTAHWMRRLSVDELPQLWNVLRGDMSLIGPRPLLRRELPFYPADALALYAQVRPGITGLWQVNGRSHSSFADRASYDSWYVRNWSLWIDWVILLKTVRVVISGRGAL